MVTVSTVTFESSDASRSTKCFTIEMTDDTVLERDEDFAVTISASGASTLVGLAIVTIEDNDGGYTLPMVNTE